MILGIFGRAHHGKDAIGDYLINQHHFSKYKFADPLKQGAMAMFGFTYEQMYDEKLKEEIDPFWGVTPRSVLQVLGTELLQFGLQEHLPDFKFGRKIWVKRFQQWYESNKLAIAEWTNDCEFDVVISDVRFQHEVDIIKEMGGEVWKVVRPSIQSDDDHASESEMGALDASKVFINDGTLIDLYSKVDEALK